MRQLAPRWPSNGDPRTRSDGTHQRKSGGRLDITLYTNSLLGGDTAMISQTIAGALEMYTLPLDLLAAKNPACGIFGVGYAFLDYSHI